MPDEKIDKSKGIIERFSTDLKNLDSYDSYKLFTLKYFNDQDCKETMLTIIGLAELGGRDLNEWASFRKYFVYEAFEQFAKLKASFVDEGIRLGFLQ